MYNYMTKVFGVIKMDPRLNELKIKILLCFYRLDKAESTVTQDTKILFLDEPTTYLDIRYQLQILKLVRKLNEEYGMTVIMVLHDINQSLYYSDEIVAMKDGRITAQGKPEEIMTSELIKKRL